MATAAKTNFTEDDIRERVGASSFGRGRGYFRGGSIIRPERHGQTIKALCRGSMPAPYRVQATLGPRGIASADCSCPIGDGGYCKHVATLLLTWLDKPARFVETADVDEVLKNMTKTDLIALVRLMIDREPSFEEFLKFTPVGSETAELPDVDSIRGRVREALKQFEDAWDDESGGSYPGLSTILDLAGGYSRAGQHAGAAMIYAAVALEIVEGYEDLYDEDESLAGRVASCVEAIGEALGATKGVARRAPMIRALFEIRQEAGASEFSLAENASDQLLARTTSQERRKVARWLREADGDEDESVHAAFLFDLEKDDLDDAAFLRIGRPVGRRVEVAGRLLKLGRLADAQADLESAPEDDAVTIAEAFAALGLAEVASRVVRSRIGASASPGLRRWLLRMAHGRGDWAEARDQAEKLFRVEPSLSAYRELKDVSIRGGSWDDGRPQILRRIEKAKRDELLIEIHLDDGEPGPALETLGRLKASGYYNYESLAFRVARCCEADRPRDAARLLLGLALRSIDRRGRDQYAEAAALLARVRGLYERLGEEDVWRELIADVRDQNRRLYALGEELDAAKL